MKIKVTFDINDEDREAIARYYGVDGKATVEDCKDFIEGSIKADIEAIYEYPYSQSTEGE